jgi:hypothetical protein
MNESMSRVLIRILPPVEIISLFGVLVGVGMRYMGMTNGDEVFLLFMSTLAAVYFLNAYIKPATEESEGQEGFFYLLATSIVRKVAWIACAVVMMGALFLLFHLNGGLEMLYIGCSAVVAAILIMVIFLLKDSERSYLVMPTLYRAVPVCLLGIYLLTNKPA